MKFCPMKMISPDYGVSELDCEGNLCAWWNENACAVLSIPAEIRACEYEINDAISNVADGIKSRLEVIYSKI